MLMKKLFIPLLFLAAASGLSAFQFHPITMEFSDSGSNASQTFRVFNDGEERIALALTMHHRSMSPDGKELLEDAEDDFIIFPERIVLEAGAERMVRVQYRGDRVDNLERAYRIIVEQIPVTFNPETNSGGLKILFRYIGSIYVLPENLQVSTTIQDFRRVTDSEGDVLTFDIMNSGTSHVILQDLEIVLESAGMSHFMTPEELTGISGSNLLAGALLTCSIAWPPGFSLENGIEGRMTYRELR